ncbi:uncharacterized protein LOC135340061 isoform X3 [Halichondria panicea]|uniref:uncharacterized protein LOC135340061 isoform X3 n=1 Tax=Halichondria panicea TaxID=6063 RepID=UPI00312B51F3
MSGLVVPDLERKYTSFLYYLRSELHKSEIHFVVCLNHEIYVTHVREEYSSKEAILGVSHLVEFEEDRITLDIPMAGVEVSGELKITPVFYPTVIKKHVDQFKPGQRIPHCSLMAEMTMAEMTNKRKKSVPMLFHQHQIRLVGARAPYNSITINLDSQEMFLGSFAQPMSTALQQLMDKCQLTTLQINREIQQEDIPFLAVHFDNVDFYIYVMGLSPGEQSDVRLKEMRSNHLAMIECLIIWKRRELSQATFRALLEMLVKLGKEEIAEQICHYLSPPQPQPMSTALQQLMDKCQLTTLQINREIQQEDIPLLAGHFDNVDFYIYVMELSPGEQSDVRLKKIKSNHLAMIECLTIWKRGKASQATFRALLEMLVKLRKEEIAEQICHYLTELSDDQSPPVYQQPPGLLKKLQTPTIIQLPERTPLTQDEIDALQKLIEGTEVNIDTFIATGQGITLEEAQQLFSQKGYIEDARNLRTKLKEIAKEQQRYLEILKDLMTAADTIDLRYLKLFLVGPPFVGKTTTLSRLLKVFENIHSAGDKAKLQSTLLANCIQAFAFVGDDAAEWRSSSDFDSEAKIVFNYFCGHKQIAKEAPLDIPLSKEHTTPPKPARTQPRVQQAHTPNSQVETLDDQKKACKDQRISDIVSRFQKLIKSGEYSNLFNALGTFLNINDIGGQPGFLEMLPALSNGPAMYLVFLDLRKELNKPYKIPFSRDETIITPYDSIHTVKDTVSQILSSISSVHCNPQVTSSFKTDTVAGFREKLECFLQVSPLAALIGTHKDKLENPEEVIEEKSQDLKDIVQKFDEVMIFPSANSSSKVLFTVDNYTGTEQSDIAPLRKFLSKIFHKRFKDASLPIRPKWLLFGLILRREYKIASVEDCLELGKKLEMDENETKFCLRYLHDCVGTVMHYTNITNDKEKWLKNRVICSPQVVFDSISQLILPSLRELHSGGTFTEYERKELIRKGQYSAEAIEMYCKTAQVSKKLGNNELIPAKVLITLLQHLNLLSEIIHIDVNNKSKYRSTYLMPAILECVSLTNPPPPDANNPEPLLITFSCGYVPTGAFCGLITQLVSQGPHGILGLTWKLVENENGVKRNCVSFVIDAVHTATIISRERYYEIRVCWKKSKKSVNEICAYVWSVIQYILSGLYERLVPQIAFQCHCPKHSEKPNLNDLCSISLGSEVRFLCESSKEPVTLRKTQMVWLGKAISIGQSASLGVFGFVKEQSLKKFSFNWSKVGEDDTQPPIHPCKPNILTFQSVSEEDLDYYRCEIPENVQEELVRRDIYLLGKH